MPSPRSQSLPGSLSPLGYTGYFLGLDAVGGGHRAASPPSDASDCTIASGPRGTLPYSSIEPRQAEPLQYHMAYPEYCSEGDLYDATFTPLRDTSSKTRIYPTGEDTQLLYGQYTPVNYSETGVRSSINTCYPDSFLGRETGSPGGRIKARVRPAPGDHTDRDGRDSHFIVYTPEYPRHSLIESEPLSPISPFQTLRLLPPSSDVYVSQREDDIQYQFPSYSQPPSPPFTPPRALRYLLPEEAYPETLGTRYSSKFPHGHHIASDFLSQYDLVGEIGSGGYGFVLVAQHRATRARVCVKFIVKDNIPSRHWIYDPGINARVPIEVYVLKYANHKGIIGYEGLFEDSIYFYLVQELHGSPWKKVRKSKSRHASPDSSAAPDASLFSPQRPSLPRLPSHDLFECIEQHSRLHEDDAKYIFTQVVDTVAYLDSLGIAHRDIKDENLVIDENLKVKLIDFGSAVIWNSERAPPFYDRFYGTKTFASSEILRKKPYQAAPAEAWSLGVLLCFLVAGQSPFVDVPAAIAGTISRPKKGTVSRECMHLIRGCLRVDPHERYTVEQIKCHPWLRS